ncbi:MAG: hypothetical protein NVV73_18680 [Cellvibrionaceae bacterium]|nr:hypothetical protein [Cellvibrionaceae bacterium]
MKRLWPLFFLMFAAPVSAQDDALMIDQSVGADVKLAFPNERNIQPRSSNFQVVNYVPMSNEQGERWAIVTLKNTSAGSRIFESQYLMGLFADGDRRAPSEFKQTIEGNEVVSVTLSFGRHKFPLLNVIARD